MTPQTLEALKGSIEKWRKIVEEGGVDQGPLNCPLCKLFWKDDLCTGCPVAGHTGKPDCEDSPYDEWENVTNYQADAKAHTPEQIAAARAELEFLRSLLPQEAVS